MLLFLILLQPLGSVDAAIYARLQNEAAMRWTIAQDKDNRPFYTYSAVTTYINTPNDDPKRAVKSTTVIARNGNSYSATTVKQNQVDVSGIVKCQNSAYSFELRGRGKDRPEYTLKSTGKPLTDESYTGGIDWPDTAYSFNGKVGDVLSEKLGNQLISLQQKLDGKVLAVIRGNTKLHAKSSPSAKEYTREILFDPLQYWCVLEDTLIQPGISTTHTVFSYEATSSSPMLKRKTTEVTYFTNNTKLKTVTEYTFVRSAPSEDEFRLAAFGLPEPEGVVWENPTPTYMWLLLGAGAFGLFALLFGYLKRRSSRASRTPRPA